MTVFQTAIIRATHSNGSMIVDLTSTDDTTGEVLEQKGIRVQDNAALVALTNNEATVVLLKLRLREYRQIIQDLENGVNPVTKTYKYWTKKAILQKIYDDTADDEARAANRLNFWQNARNQIALWLSAN